jgi:hypothetical protein
MIATEALTGRPRSIRTYITYSENGNYYAEKSRKTNERIGKT